MRLVKPGYEILSDIDPEKILKLLELAGRTCYKSEGKVSKETARKFCEMVLKRGHESVIEHVSITVKFIIDRGVSHELVRHRLCSFSQESTRYCNYKGGVTFVIPPWVDIEPGEYNEYNIPQNRLDCFWYNSMLGSEEYYQRLVEKISTQKYPGGESWSPQQARSVLPNSLKTEIVTTANIREWRHIFKLRCSKAAHPQMREVMIPLRDELRKRIPVLFEEN